MSCDRVRAALDHWDPAGDLADDVVAHLDHCPQCLAAFDAAFPSPVPPRAAATASGGERRPSSRSSRLAAAAAVALLAASFLVVLPPSLGPVPATVAHAEPETCPPEPWQPPVCPAT